MRYQSMAALLTGVVVGLGAAVLLLDSGAVREAAAQGSSSYRAPRSAYGDGKPDLNGVWQALNTAYWNIEPHPAGPGYTDGPAWMLGAIVAESGGAGVVEGGRIPYRPEMLERRAANFRNRLVADQYKRDQGDGELKCYLPGPVRATYLPYPFHVAQTDKYINIAYEFAHANRVIYLAKHVEPPVDTWMGWSNGRWEGDTLVVDVLGLTGDLWLDRAGNFLGEGAKVTERYTRTGPDHLQYEATIENPGVFTRPWTIRMPLYRRVEPGAQIFEFKCVEYVEQMMYGRLTKGWKPFAWDPSTQQPIAQAR
jgi:hypothetical protein